MLLVLFALSSRAHRSPLLDPALLRIPSFGLASLATVVAGLGFYAYLLTNILWLQYVWGYTVLEAGLALVPGALVAAVVAARLGPLANRYGYRPFVVPGAIVWAGAYVWYHQQVGVEPAFWTQWFPGQIISGIGVGATLPLLGSAALAAVPGARYATASALVSSARQLGGVLGIAILVVILDDPTPATAVTAFRARLDPVDRRLPRRRRAGPAARAHQDRCRPRCRPGRRPTRDRPSSDAGRFRAHRDRVGGRRRPTSPGCRCWPGCRRTRAAGWRPPRGWWRCPPGTG